MNSFDMPVGATQDDQAQDAACPLPVEADSPAGAQVAEALAAVRTVAIVGASPNPARTSHQVTQWLIEHSHFELYLVNPAAAGEDLQGHGFYPSLDALPEAPDLVCVFRREEFVPVVAEQALAVDAGGLWLQLGIRSPESVARFRDSGRLGVQNRCLKVEYARHAEAIAALRG